MKLKSLLLIALVAIVFAVAKVTISLLLSPLPPTI